MLSPLGEDEGGETGKIGKSGEVEEDSIFGTGIDHDVLSTGIGCSVYGGTNYCFGSGGDSFGCSFAV